MEGTPAHAERTARKSARGRTAAIALALAAAVAAVLVAIVLASGGDDGSAQTKVGVPSAVSAQQLGDFARSKGEPVYWAGEVPGTKLELTETSRGYVFVRYLDRLAPIGDAKPNYTTIGTYPQTNALAAVRRAANGRGTVTRRVSGGGLAVWSIRRGTSVYLAFPGSKELIEVYNPRARTAQALAVSGRIQPAS